MVGGPVRMSTVLLLSLLARVMATHTIVQTLSSRYALVLGGYGPGYTEMARVDLVRHHRVCGGLLSDIPSTLARFLGDVSGLAEFVDDKVIFCRHTECWALDIVQNRWSPMAPLNWEREQAMSVAVGGTMLVLGTNDNNSTEVEVYDPALDTWTVREELSMKGATQSSCVTPVNETALMVLGGWAENGATDSVQVLDLVSGDWREGAPLPTPRYGHTCLLTEVQGTPGIMVAGGALGGKQVDFLNLKTSEWSKLPDLNYNIDGHKLILVEGIPTMFSWENIEMFDGDSWVLQPFRLPESRSAFTVTSVPGHLVPGCS